jgi:group I intron endonuclease
MSNNPKQSPELAGQVADSGAGRSAEVFDAEERACVLYRIVHRQTGKDYVGISIDYVRRWSEHRRGKGNRRLCSAIKKYGVDAFDWIVVARARSFQSACVLERLAIALGWGSYNFTAGGEGLGNPSPEVRAALRAGRLGKKHSEASRALMSQQRKGRRHTPEALAKMRQRKGKRHTPESIEKMRQSQRAWRLRKNGNAD